MENKEIETIEELEEAKDWTLKLKCKPAYNFQSIEFEYEIKEPDDLEFVFGIYQELLEGLIRLAPDQNSEFVEPATESQLAILRKFNIKHKPNVSKKEASELIQKSMKK